MHEAAFSRAARPAPVVVLGLLMRPYSIGHYTLLIREGNPMAESDKATPAQLAEAALLCAQTWEQSARMPFDPLIGFKLWIWKLRVRGTIKMFPVELQNFIDYRNAGSLELPMSEWPHPSRSQGSQRRPQGTPFLLQLWHFLRVSGETEAAAWDHPFGFAKMRWQAHWEDKEGLDVWNHQDQEQQDAYDKHCEAERKKREEAECL